MFVGRKEVGAPATSQRCPTPSLRKRFRVCQRRWAWKTRPRPGLRFPCSSVFGRDRTGITRGTSATARCHHSSRDSSSSAGIADTPSVTISEPGSIAFVAAIGAAATTACAGAVVVSDAGSVAVAADLVASAAVILKALNPTIKAAAENATTHRADIIPQPPRRRSAITVARSWFATSSDGPKSASSRDGSELRSGEKRLSNSLIASVAPESRTAERRSS